MNSDDDLVELYHNFIEEYILQQFILGRLSIMESEIYEQLGYPFPPDKPDRRFQLRGGVITSWDFEEKHQKNSNNILRFSDYKR